MELTLLVLYNLVAVGLAFAGLVLERRRPRLGVALLLLSVLVVINLFVGGAILFVPLILALYGTVLGLPALAVWWLVRRRRARRQFRTPGARPNAGN
jgi:hypothetical protein